MLKFVTALSCCTDRGVGPRRLCDRRQTPAIVMVMVVAGPIPPSYSYKTKKVYKNVTRHRDV